MKNSFPSVEEILNTFKGKGKLESKVYSALFILNPTRWSKKRQYALLARIKEELQAKNELVDILYEKRKISKEACFKSLDGFKSYWENPQYTAKLSYSIISGRDLLGEQIGQIYEGGGYIGIETKRKALKELVKEGHILEIPADVIQIAERLENYYILFASSPERKPIFDVPGIGDLLQRMKSKLRKFKIARDPSERIFDVALKSKE